MKIALITIHNANNYGAVLQAYATKKILSEYGEVSTINYDNKYLSHQLDILRFEFSIHGIKMLVHDILRLLYHIKVIHNFKNFIDLNMNLTPVLSAKDLMQGKAGIYDVYICGSDQIWNPEIVNKDAKIDPIYFLSFASKNAKKISYASSIGHHHYNDDEKKEIKELLNDFSLISTREIDGVKKLKEILPDKEIKHVLDPTLLLSRDEWISALNIKPKKPKEEYILVYSVPRTELLKKAVKYFKNKLNMKVVAIDKMLFPIAKVDKHIKDAGLKEFVELYEGASLVITDSFHGTCFAVNFGIPLVSIFSGKKSNRVVNFLTLLNIENKVLYNENELASFDLRVDYITIFHKLEEMKYKSLEILKTSIINTGNKNVH